ncbi:unnamed protein product, partial [Orchesella dallaii]
MTRKRSPDSKNFGLLLILFICLQQLTSAQPFGYQILKPVFQNQNLGQCINVYVHGSKELQQLEEAHAHYDNLCDVCYDIPRISSMCLQTVVLTSNYTSKISKEVSRYQEMSSVILFPVQMGNFSKNSIDNAYIKTVVYDVFDNSFQLSSYPLYLLVDNADLFKQNMLTTKLSIQKLPPHFVLLAFKTMELQNGRKKIAPYMYYICDSYCPKQKWTKWQPHKRFSSLISLHKQMSYNANSRPISIGMWASTVFIPQNVLSHCLENVPRTMIQYCRSRIMIAGWLSKIHNFTARLFNIRKPSEDRAYEADTDPFITSPMRILVNGNFFHRTYQLMYDQNFGTMVYYCSMSSPRVMSKSKCMHWIQPFSVSVWIVCFLMLLGIPFLISMVQTKSIFYSILVVIGAVGVVLKQYTVIVGCRMLIFTSFLGLLVVSFYESQITSLAIVQMPPKTIQSMFELVNKGYKIIKNEESYTGFELDFNFMKLDDFAKLWYSIGNINHDNYDNLNVKFLAEGKYASFVTTEYIQYNIMEKTELVRKETGVGGYDCHIIPEEIGKGQKHWKLEVKNKYWLERSLRFMQTAGLQDIWDQWSYWHERFRFIIHERNLQSNGTWLGESLFHKKNLGPGLILVQELAAFMLLALCPLIVSILLLVGEIYGHYTHNINQGNKVITIIEWRTYRSLFLYPDCS